MTKAIAAPQNPETELNREDIAQLTGASICKVTLITIKDKWGFPKTIRPGPKGKLLFSRSAVEDWLNHNDIKSIIFTADDRAPRKKHKKSETNIHSAGLVELRIGIRPKKFSRYGKSVCVHVPERDVHSPLNPKLTRFSHSGADHRSHIGSSFE
jgi:hypothetical protein